MDLAEIVLGLLRASRAGDFELHLTIARYVIPWCLAYDRLNCARYLPYIQICRLSSDHLIQNRLQLIRTES